MTHQTFPILSSFGPSLRHLIGTSSLAQGFEERFRELDIREIAHQGSLSCRVIIEPDHGDNLAGIRDGTGMISLLDAGRRAVVEQGDGQ